MKKIYKNIFRIIFLFLILFIAIQAYANQWQTMKVGVMQLHFTKQHESQAKYLAGLYHRIMPEISRKFDHKIHDVHIIIHDNMDISNGYSSFFPYNSNGLYLSPPIEGELLNNQDWLETLVRHELVHLYHFDSSKDFWNSTQNIFGRVLILFPALYLPEWIIEGIATHAETNIEEGTGRGGTGYFDAIMRLEKQRGFMTIHEVTYNRNYLPSGVSYYYGYYFFEFLKENYGEQKIYETMQNINGNFPYFYDDDFREKYFRNIYVLWDEYITYLDIKFSRQIQKIHKTGIQEGYSITEQTLKLPVAKYDLQGRLHYLHADPYDGKTSLIRQDLPDSIIEKKGTDAKKITSTTVLATGKGFLDFDLQPEQVVYTKLNICDIHDDWKEGIYYDIHVITIHTDNHGGKNITDKVIAPCQRYAYVRWYSNGKYIIALKHVSGIAQLDLLDRQGQLVRNLYTGQLHETLGRFDISEDGKSLVIARKIARKNWDIYIFDMQKNIQWKKITNNKAIDIDPIFTDNNSITFVSNRSGTFNIWQKFILNKTSNHNQAQSITNTLSATFQPSIHPQGGIIYAKLIPYGFQVMRIPLSAKPVTQLFPPRQKNTQYHNIISISNNITPYSSLTGLAPHYWLPLLQADRDKVIFGAQTGGIDVLGNHQYFLSAAGYAWQHFSPRNTYNYTLSYTFRDIFSISSYQYDRIYDRRNDLSKKSAIFSTKQQQALSVNLWQKANIERSFTVFHALSTQKDAYYTVGLADNTIDNSYENRASLGVYYIENYQGRLSPLSSGIQFQILSEQSIHNQNRIGRTNTAYVTWAFPLRFLDASKPTKHGGFDVLLGQTDKRQSFEFGGIGNISIPFFGRQSFPLAGYASGEGFLRTHEFIYMQTDIEMPITNKNIGFMVPPLGAGNTSAGLFVENIYMYQPNTEFNTNTQQKNYASIGIQLSSDLILGYRFIVPIRFIYATGIHEGGITQFGLVVGAGTS